MRKYAHWAAAAILTLLYVSSATMYITEADKVRGMLAALGYPAHLMPILIAAKFLAIAAILSRASVALSDLACAGILYHLLLALNAHWQAGEFAQSVGAVAGLFALVIFFVTQNHARARPSPYAPVPQVAPSVGNPAS